MRKTISAALLLFCSAIVICLAPLKNVYASTKTYGFSSPNKDYLYSQNKEWWKDVGDGSNVNGSAIASFATVASIINDKKITPASIAKIAYEKNYWNLSGTPPTDLIKNLLSEYSDVKSTIAAGSSTSVRISATSKAFTKVKKSAIIVRATGSSPFNTSEKGGHYIVILAYKTDGKIYVYDPATGKLSWKKAKTVYNTMKKNIMFYAITFSASESDNLEIFSPTSPAQDEGVGDSETPQQGEDSEAPESAAMDEDSETPSEEQPSKEPETQPTTESDEQKAVALADKALEAAWPVIGSDDIGYCYNSSNVYYKWNTHGSDVHNTESCGSNIRKEYETMLKAAGISYNSAAERQKIENLFIAIFNATGIDTNIKTSLKNTPLLKYLEANLTKLSNTQPKYGDIIYANGIFYIYVDYKGGEYGNVITSKVNSETPHIESYTLTSNSTIDSNAIIFRFGNGTTPEDGGSSGDGQDQIPTDDQTGEEQEASDPESPSPVGERIAARAMSFSWPYTGYSTNDATLKGKCVAKYKTMKTAKTLSTYPNETNKTWKLKTYPTGTKCNTTVTTAYAKYLKLSTTSSINKQSITSIGFVSDVYSSLGIGLPYSDITELRKKLGDKSDWELITKTATTETEFMPGDLLIAKDVAMIYVGDLGGVYGKVAQAYKGKWTPRLTPLYLKDTYVFRYKNGTNIIEDGNCSELTIESAEGNEKIAVAASNMSWPYRTGSNDKIGKCQGKSGLVSYPSIYTITSTNKTITSKAKSEKTLAKEQKNTKCLDNFTESYDSAISKLPNLKKKSNLGLIISALYSAGIKQPNLEEYTGTNDTEWLFNVIELDKDNWEIVSNKLTSSNKTELIKRGDLIFKLKKTKKKVTYEEVMIYIGKYGKDCFGLNYGNIATASSSATPHITKLTFESKADYYVFRAKPSAYDEPTASSPESETSTEPVTPTEDPGTPEEPEPESQGMKIAQVAMSFSWPFNKYNVTDSKLWGKCIYWFPGRTPTNDLVEYPQPYKDGKFKDKTNSGTSENIGKIGTYYACANTIPPLRAINSTVGISGLKGKSLSDVVDMVPGGANYGTYNVGFNATISGLKDKITFQSRKGFSKYDCIKFVTDVLIAAGASKKTNVYGSSALDKQDGWKKIGDSIVNNINDLKKSSKLVTDQGIELEPGDVVVRDENMGKHTFIWLGQMGWPWGDRTEGGKDEYAGGLIMDTFINSDPHIYNYGKGLKVYRYYGK